jgi:hypothetical protein
MSSRSFHRGLRGIPAVVGNGQCSVSIPTQPSNYHVVAPLGGEWTDGLIEGDLLPEGWAAELGYPEFPPRVGGSDVAVQVLTAPSVATA